MKIKKGDSFKVKFQTSTQKKYSFFKEDEIYTCTNVIVFPNIDDEIYVGINWVSSDLCIKV